MRIAVRIYDRPGRGINGIHANAGLQLNSFFCIGRRISQEEPFVRVGIEETGKVHYFLAFAAKRQRTDRPDFFQIQKKSAGESSKNMQ
jgi:hypothetical protein